MMKLQHPAKEDFYQTGAGQHSAAQIKSYSDNNSLFFDIPEFTASFMF
jgi:hypothetical protein